MLHMTRSSICSALCVLALAAPNVSTAAGRPGLRIGESAARAAALRAVPNGTIQSAELEQERGRKVWSIDVKKPHSTTVVELLVDAETGRIVSKRTESLREQQKEAEADAAKPSR